MQTLQNIKAGCDPGYRDYKVHKAMVRVPTVAVKMPQYNNQLSVNSTPLVQRVGSSAIKSVRVLRFSSGVGSLGVGSAEYTKPAYRNRTYFSTEFHAIFGVF